MEMEGLTRVSVNFETSHLIFPWLIGIVLVLLGLAIAWQRRHELAGAGSYWQDIVHDMDKVRFLGTIVLTVVYFSLMVPVGEIWPNTGRGFLFCSIPYVFLTGVLFMQERTLRQIAVMAAIALIAPTFVWWLFFYIFFLTLP